MSDPSLAKLQNAKVEPSLKNFQRGAVNSVQMLSLGFYGIIEAFQDEMEKSRGVQEKIESAFENITNLNEELKNCNAKCTEINNKLTQEMKKMNKMLSIQSKETDDKLFEMQETLKDECNKTRKQCQDAVDLVSNKVGKSLENVDRLQSDFENLEQETNDQIRSLSSRCEENKELIEEQDNKFKDQLNELTEILHAKGLELDEKIQSCLNETSNKIEQFDAKQQEFQFEINKELSQKADIEDLKHKLDINTYDEFIENNYNDFTKNIDENLNEINSNIDNQQSKQNEICDDVSNIKSKHDTFKSFIDQKFNEMQAMIQNPFDIDTIKNELNEQIISSNENLRKELMAMIQNGPAALQPPSIGTKSGQCIACGRGPSNFQPLPVKSPSPTKKPKHGGGFNRLPSRRKTIDSYSAAANAVRKSVEIIDERGRDDQDISIKSPKSTTNKSRRKSLSYLADTSKANKINIENDPVRVQLSNGAEEEE